MFGKIPWWQEILAEVAAFSVFALVIGVGNRLIFGKKKPPPPKEEGEP